MATKTKPPEHLAGARSAKCLGGLAYRDGHLQYVVPAGVYVETTHPAVIAYPDKFAPSGEAPRATRPTRDSTPKPRKIKAPLEHVLVLRCKDGTCDFAVEADPDDTAAIRAAQRQHVHTTTT